MKTRHIVLAFTTSAFALAGVGLFGRTAGTEDHPRVPEEVRSIEVRNECSDPVWISYGRSTPLRKEDAVTLGPGITSVESMLEGDTVWLLDEARAPIDSATVTEETQRVVVGPSCLKIDAHQR